MQSNQMSASICDKAQSLDEPYRNYITLLDLDNQNQLRICHEARSRNGQYGYKLQNPLGTIASNTSLGQNKLSVYDWLPLKVYNSSISMNDQFQLGIPTNKRIESLSTEKLSSKLSSSVRTTESPVFMKDLKTLIHSTCSQQCLFQNCTCSNPTKNLIKGNKGSCSRDSPIKAEGKQHPYPTQVPHFNSYQGSSDGLKIDLQKAPRKKKKSCSKKALSIDKAMDNNSNLGGNKKKSSTRTCTKCGLTFSSHREVLLHSKVHISEKSKEFGCHLCGKFYSQRTTLRQHLILHSGEKNFVCTVCEKRFALKIYLKSHQKSCVPVH